MGLGSIFPPGSPAVSGGGGPTKEIVCNKLIVGNSVNVTRPNNATPYASGQIFGDAANALITLPVPALPASARTGGVVGLSIRGIRRGTIGASNALTLGFLLFSSAPAAAYGDQASIALSDADIARLLLGGTLSPNTPAPGFAFAAPNIGNIVTVNATAGALALRQATAFSAIPILALGGLAPGGNLYMYAYVNGAYTPVANEIVTIVPYWTFSCRI